MCQSSLLKLHVTLFQNATFYQETFCRLRSLSAEPLDARIANLYVLWEKQTFRMAKKCWQQKNVLLLHCFAAFKTDHYFKAEMEGSVSVASFQGNMSGAHIYVFPFFRSLCLKERLYLFHISDGACRALHNTYSHSSLLGLWCQQQGTRT